MSFKIDDKVRLNPAIVTKEFLRDCRFDASIPKLIEMAEKGTVCTIKKFEKNQLRSSAIYCGCAILYDDKGTRIGWLPLKALVPLTANVLPPLTAGTVFKTRREDYFIVISAEKAFRIHNMGGQEGLYHWDNITGKHCSRKDFDIVAVYNTNNMCGFVGLKTATPIWTETTPAREMTVAEIEKALGHGIKVVGEDGTEYTF